MNKDIELKVSYVGTPYFEYEGIEEFDNALKQCYSYDRKVVIIEDVGGDASGITIEVITNFLFQSFVSGIIGDIISRGKNSLALRYFFEKYESLKEKNTDSLDIAELTFTFKDIKITIEKVSDNSIVNNYERIIEVLASNYSNLISQSNQVLKEVIIPIMKETETNICEFRFIHGEDIVTDKVSEKDYFLFWVLNYSNKEKTHVYDVGLRKVLSEPCMELDEYFDIVNKN